MIERVYSAGRDKLRTIGWFARLMDWLIDFRDRVFAWVPATERGRFFTHSNAASATFFGACNNSRLGFNK